MPFGAVNWRNPAEIRQTPPRKKPDRCPSSGSRVKPKETNQKNFMKINQYKTTIASLALCDFRTDGWSAGPLPKTQPTRKLPACGPGLSVTNNGWHCVGW
jgi:hypothetical protein